MDLPCDKEAIVAIASPLDGNRCAKLRPCLNLKQEAPLSKPLGPSKVRNRESASSSSQNIRATSNADDPRVDKIVAYACCKRRRWLAFSAQIKSLPPSGQYIFWTTYHQTNHLPFTQPEVLTIVGWYIGNTWYQYTISIMVSKNLPNQHQNFNTCQILIPGGYH
jgi:hypothetical protein